ncbi:retrotransposon protein, putative, ty1-copia subclass [Tanacetum coccineum]
MLVWLVLQGLRGSKKLKHKALSLYMGNGKRAAVEAIRSFDLVLPSGLIIILDNCHFTPTITRVVLISCLVNNSYIHTFRSYGISVSKDNVFYFNAIPHDGIYEIDMHNLYPNDSSMFNVSNKRSKHVLDSSYLWHCRLGHINKKCMDMLQRDGMLQPTHDESLEKCKSCIFGKMARKPFPHHVERAKDLLGLIHTNVCGPFRTVSREDASYFITFIDDFSRYARILNMVLTKKVERTPYEIWHGKAPKLSYLRVWGCEALVKRDTPDKLDPRSIKCIFVGYPKETMGYYFYYPLENKIFVARNAEFFENSLMVQEASGSHGLLESSGSDGGLELIQEEDTQPSENTSKVHNEVAPIEVEPQNVEVPIRRSARIPQAPDRYGFYVDVEEYELGDLNEPPNYKAALSDPEFDKWLEAMNTEMQSMKDNQVWVLVDLPPNGRTVRSKWIFKKKTDMQCTYL